MNVSAREKYPNPFQILSLDFLLEKTDKAILDLGIVESLDIAADHHVEKQERREHEELLCGVVPHVEHEELSIALKESCVLDPVHSTAVNE